MRIQLGQEDQDAIQPAPGQPLDRSAAGGPTKSAPPALPAAFSANAAPERVVATERIRGMEVKSFLVPPTSLVRAGMLAAGMALVPTPTHALALQGRTQGHVLSAVEQSAMDARKMDIRDRGLQSAGFQKALPPPAPGANPWFVVAAMATVASALGNAARMVQRREREAKSAEVRKSYVSALDSEFRAVRLDGLAGIQKFENFSEVPVAKILEMANEKDPTIAREARKVLTHHPDTPVEVLKALVERESTLSIRMEAQRALDSLRPAIGRAQA